MLPIYSYLRTFVYDGKIIGGKSGDQASSAIKNVSLNGFYYLGIGEKMVHLMNPTSLTLIFMVMGVLVIVVAIFVTQFHNHTYTVAVVMMAHHRR